MLWLTPINFCHFRNPLLPLLVIGNKSDLDEDTSHVEIEAIVTIDWEAKYAEYSCEKDDKENLVTILEDVVRKTTTNTTNEVKPASIWPIKALLKRHLK